MLRLLQVFVALIWNSPRLRGAPQLMQRLLDWLKTSFTERSAFILYTKELHLSHTTLTNIHMIFISKLIRVFWRNLYKMYSYYWLPWSASLQSSLIFLTIYPLVADHPSWGFRYTNHEIAATTAGDYKLILMPSHMIIYWDFFYAPIKSFWKCGKKLDFKSSKIYLTTTSIRVISEDIPTSERLSCWPAKIRAAFATL